MKKILEDGVPCSPGCLSHRSHPCERCGRVSGMSDKFTKEHVIGILEEFIQSTTGYHSEEDCIVEKRHKECEICIFLDKYRRIGLVKPLTDFDDDDIL